MTAHPSTLNVVRLPAVVDEAAYFEAGPDVTFDLSATVAVSGNGLCGLVAAARKGPVPLILVPGPVQRKLERLFTGHLVERSRDWLLRF